MKKDFSGGKTGVKNKIGYGIIAMGALCITIGAGSLLTHGTTAEEAPPVETKAPLYDFEALVREKFGEPEETCPHDWEAGYSTADCGIAGKQYYHCTLCGLSKAEDVFATGEHEFEMVAEESVCYETCRKCGIISNRRSHDFVMVERTGSCEHFTETLRCTYCDKIITETGEEEHDFGAAFAFDENRHFRICTKCYAFSDEEGHDLTEGVCTVCKADLSGDFLCPHGKLFGEGGYDWLREIPGTGDCEYGTLRHFECAVCGERFIAEDDRATLTDVQNGSVGLTPVSEDELVIEDGTHEYEDDCDEVCDVCGYVREGEHEFSEVKEFDGLGHFYVCINCGKEKDRETHEFSDWIVDEDGGCANVTHRHIECRDCDIILVEEDLVFGHSFGQWTIKDPTCETAGYADRSCEKCKEKQHLDIDALGHRLARLDEKEAGRLTGNTEDVVFLWSCENCGEIFFDKDGKKRFIPTTPVEPVVEAPLSKFGVWFYVPLISGAVLLLGGIGLLLLSKKFEKEERRGSRHKKLEWRE